MQVSSLTNESPLYISKLKRYMRLMLNMNSPIYRYISNVQYNRINLRHCIWRDINQIRMIRNHKNFFKINYSIKLIYFSKIIRLIFLWISAIKISKIFPREDTVAHKIYLAAHN